VRENNYKNFALYLPRV